VCWATLIFWHTQSCFPHVAASHRSFTTLALRAVGSRNDFHFWNGFPWVPTWLFIWELIRIIFAQPIRFVAPGWFFWGFCSIRQSQVKSFLPIAAAYHTLPHHFSWFFVPSTHQVGSERSPIDATPLVTTHRNHVMCGDGIRPSSSYGSLTQALDVKMWTCFKPKCQSEGEKMVNVDPFMAKCYIIVFI
jgi:hypothetical protein